jgi:hypothetical protein
MWFGVNFINVLRVAFIYANHTVARRRAYSKHGQSVTLQFIFAALGAVLLLGKASNISPLKQNLTKFVLNSSQLASKRLSKYLICRNHN